MTITPNELPDDLATAHELIRELAKTVHAQEHLIAKLQHQLEQLPALHWDNRKINQPCTICASYGNLSQPLG